MSFIDTGKQLCRYKGVGQFRAQIGNDQKITVIKFLGKALKLFAAPVPEHIGRKCLEDASKWGQTDGITVYNCTDYVNGKNVLFQVGTFKLQNDEGKNK